MLHGELSFENHTSRRCFIPFTIALDRELHAVINETRNFLKCAACYVNACPISGPYDVFVNKEDGENRDSAYLCIQKSHLHAVRVIRDVRAKDEFLKVFQNSFLNSRQYCKIYYSWQCQRHLQRTANEISPRS